MRVLSSRIVRAVSRLTDAQRSAGAAWYPEARLFVSRLSSQSGYGIEVTAGVVAALSPRNRWAFNKKQASEMLLGLAAHPAGAMSTNVNKAIDIMRGRDIVSVLSGPKTIAFYHALAGHPDGPPVIDVWAARVASGETVRVNDTNYDIFSRAYIRASNILGMDAHTVQASAWIYARNGRAA